ncbi:MAG: extracellular solute-binding protein [Armatimonadetes bacterium]|nr:extracellular solute-binding protein [Armatimonadota bacterium]
MTRREALAWLAALGAVPLGCREFESSSVALRLANWGGAGDDSDYYRLVKQIYREFEAAHPGVILKVEGVPGSQEYVTKVLLDHVAGAMPDVMALDASSGAVFIDNGTLMDLAPFVEKDKAFSLGDYFPNVVDIARRDKAIYAIPTDFTPMVVYCNAAHFREAGVAVPTGRWSFDDFLSAAQRLTRQGRYGFEFANWMPGWVMFLWNNGSDVLSPDGSRATGILDGPRSVEAVQYLADLVLKHRVAPSLSQAAATGVDLFATGKASMKVVGHWYLASLAAFKDLDPHEIVVVELPTNLPQSVTVMYEAGQAISKNCRHPEVAWEFLKFWASQGVQSRYNQSGIAVCARKDVAEASLKGEPSKVAREEAFLRIVPSARSPWGASVEGYDRVEEFGQKAMDDILKNGVPVQAALSKAAAAIDKEFALR